MKKYLINICFIISMFTFAQNLKIIPLGVYGGSDESNLSSYLLAEENTTDYIALDAGTIYSGINKAIENGSFTNTTVENILKNNIKGYFISHGHLDHLSGMLINSPEDSSKPIYAIKETIEVLKNKYFTNTAMKVKARFLININIFMQKLEKYFPYVTQILLELFLN